MTFSIAYIQRLREEIKEKHKVNTMNNLAIFNSYKKKKKLGFSFLLPFCTLLSTKITYQRLTSRDVLSDWLQDSALILRTIRMTGLILHVLCNW